MGLLVTAVKEESHFNLIFFSFIKALEPRSICKTTNMVNYQKLVKERSGNFKSKLSNLHTLSEKNEILSIF